MTTYPFSFLRPLLLATMLCLSFPLGLASAERFLDDETIRTGQDLQMGEGSVQSVSVGRDVSLNGTTVMGSVNAGRDVSAHDCTIQGHVAAGRDISLRGCPNLQSVSAGRQVSLLDVSVKGDISAGREVSLQGTHVYGNVSAGRQVNLEHSRVDQTVTTSAGYMLLKGSRIHDIQLYEPDMNQTGVSNTSIISSYNNVVIGGKHRHGTVIRQNKGGSVISVGSGSTSTVNGYTVRSTASDTTVITPDNTIYVNGTQVSGKGPKTYTAYRQQHLTAPAIHGPGWQESDAPSLSSSDQTTPGMTQVIELIDRSEVGNIRFMGGHGKVIVDADSTVTGTITGGTLERR